MLGRRVVANVDELVIRELRRLGGLLKLVHVESGGAYSERTDDALRALKAAIESLGGAGVIGKRVMNAKGRGSKAARIGALLDYIRAPEREGSDEKCAYYAGQGFVTDSPGGHRAEMIALAQDAPRSADPVNHYILSWREGEVPLPEQVEQAMGLFLDELGLQGHQAVYGMHSDTDNLHLHIVVNRVHPETQRVVKINGGFDLEALHRAVARIEHAHGWMPEMRARYTVDEQGQVVRSARDAAEQRQPAQPKRDRETHCGEPSAERVAIEYERLEVTWVGNRYVRRTMSTLEDPSADPTQPVDPSMTKRKQSKRGAQVRRRTPKGEDPRPPSDLVQASALPSAFTLSTADRRAAEMRLLANLKASLPALEVLLRENDDHWGYEDRVYRFYHQSFKVFGMQDATTTIVAALQALAPDLALNPWFLEIVADGTGKSFELEHNRRWLEVTRPIVEAFFHARFFLDMAVRYGGAL